MVDLGFAPDDLNVHLSPRADFVAALQTADGTDWPDGATITLNIGTDVPTAWEATIAGPLASWARDKADVVELGPKKPLFAYVEYTDTDGNDIEWFSGRVVWHA